MPFNRRARWYAHRCIKSHCSRLRCALQRKRQISLWQIGGAGLAWDGSDTTRIIMDINAERIRPVYFADDNMFLSVAGWSELIAPRELGYIDGHQPRLWYGDGTNVNQTSYFDSPLYVDGLRSTYNTARDGWWTIDIGVPVPATRFGFATPTEGVRSDGVPLNQDPVPAFEVSIAAETSDILAQKGLSPLEHPHRRRAGQFRSRGRDRFSPANTCALCATSAKHPRSTSSALPIATRCAAPLPNLCSPAAACPSEPSTAAEFSTWGPK